MENFIYCAVYAALSRVAKVCIRKYVSGWKVSSKCFKGKSKYQKVTWKII